MWVMKLIVILFIPFFFFILLFLLSLFFAENYATMDSSDSSFECGFESNFISRIPFSIQFFSMSVIFLLFDLEVIILLPLITSQVDFYIKCFYLSLIFFILLMGLVLEWFDGSLEWTK
uniref:NADH-ubiquinone oxidoreductase chain 3 n=1 Tax=Macrogyropus costalimai TaxID=1941320 RepID=A0A7S5WS43_9NEOP|nr:NADH dehydrogenase subunit 3 [Macrogyropus costalimai]